MSLVNDMLRDLDQRRKGTSGGLTASRLVPASEVEIYQDNRKLYIIAMGLVAVTLALAFFYLQLNRGVTTQQLGIDTPAISSTANSNTAVGEPVSAETPGEEEVIVAETASTQPPPATDLPVQTVEEIPAPAPAAEEITTTAAVVEVNTPPVTTAELAPELIAPEPTAIAPVEPAPSRNTAPAVATSNSGIQSVVVDRSAVATDSVKNRSELTAAELDTENVQKALALINANQSELAFTELYKYISLNPNAHFSRETFAKLLVNQGQAQDAFTIIEGGLALVPNHSGYKKLKARLLINDGQFDVAAQLLLSRAPTLSEDPEYHEFLAMAQLASENYEGATLSYSGLVQLDRSQGKWWYGFASAQDLLGNQEVALEAYIQAMQIPNLSASLRQRSQQRLNVLRN